MEQKEYYSVNNGKARNLTTKEVYHCSPSLVAGEYPAEMFGEPRLEYKHPISGELLIVPIEYTFSEKSLDNFKKSMGNEIEIVKYLQLKQPKQLPEKDSNEGYVDFRNPFEDYPELTERILHASSFWRVDDTWSATLAEINKVCEQLTIAKNTNWESKP